MIFILSIIVAIVLHSSSGAVPFPQYLNLAYQPVYSGPVPLPAITFLQQPPLNFNQQLIQPIQLISYGSELESGPVPVTVPVSNPAITQTATILPLKTNRVPSRIVIKKVKVRPQSGPTAALSLPGDAYPQYSYFYRVDNVGNDTEDIMKNNDTSSSVVFGKYSLVDLDGKLKTVTYRANATKPVETVTVTVQPVLESTVNSSLASAETVETTTDNPVSVTPKKPTATITLTSPFANYLYSH